MHSRLSGHKGWKDRVGAALLTAAGVFGAEGCATTNATPRDEAYMYTQTARPREQPEHTEQRTPISFEAHERNAQYTMNQIRDHHLSRYETMIELSHQMRLIREDSRPEQGAESRPLFTVRDVDPVTSTILRRVIEYVREEARVLGRETRTERNEPARDALSHREARRIALHIMSQGSLGSLASSHALQYFNGGYSIPVEDFRRFFNSQLTDEEAINLDMFITADFVRAYAHALQAQEDQAMARAYAERQRAQRQPIDTQDFPSGINFDAAPRAPLRATSSPTSLMNDPYGEASVQADDHRHHHRRHHRGR